MEPLSELTVSPGNHDPGIAMQKNNTPSNRGFAAMDEAKQREIARKGGRSVPNEKRSFSQNHQLASEAGRKGGRSSHGNRRPGENKS
jgi:general stress protein YciG